MLNFGMPVANPFVMSCRHLDRQYPTFLARNIVTVAILAQGTPRGDAFYAALLIVGSNPGSTVFHVTPTPKHRRGQCSSRHKICSGVLFWIQH